MSLRFSCVISLNSTDSLVITIAVTKIVIMRSIQVVMEKASTARHQLTNHLTKARIVIKIRSARKTRTKLRAAPTATTRTVKSPINTKVPIAHQKISIPVAVAPSTKAKTKTETASERKIRTELGPAIHTRAAPVAQSISTRKRIEIRTNTRALAHLTKTNHHRLATKIR